MALVWREKEPILQFGIQQENEVGRQGEGVSTRTIEL